MSRALPAATWPLRIDEQHARYAPALRQRVRGGPAKLTSAQDGDRAHLS